MGIDIRGGKLFNDLFEVLSDLQHKGYEYEILFLDASDDVLIKRYKETRRSHPLSKNGSMQFVPGANRSTRPFSQNPTSESASIV